MIRADFLQGTPRYLKNLVRNLTGEQGLAQIHFQFGQSHSRRRVFRTKQDLNIDVPSFRPKSILQVSPAPLLLKTNISKCLFS
jgi:hypothetical protein